jgi:hypothetical protein
MNRRVIIVVAAAIAACAAQASAQAVTAYPFRVYNQGAPAPLYGPVDVAASAFACGQTPPPPPSGTVSNPGRLVITDPSDPTKVCIYTDPGNATGVLFAVPFVTTPLEGTLAAKNGAGTGPESARSNLFTHPGSVPSAPPGFRIARLFGFGSRVLGFRRTSVGPTDRFLRLVGDDRRR